MSFHEIKYIHFKSTEMVVMVMVISLLPLKIQIDEMIVVRVDSYFLNRFMCQYKNLTILRYQHFFSDFTAPCNPGAGNVLSGNLRDGATATCLPFEGTWHSLYSPCNYMGETPSKSPLHW